MLPELEALYNHLERLHNDFKQTISGLSQDALDWVPGPEMNSLCVLVYHTTEAEKYWAGEMSTGEPVNRNRAAEFEVSGYSEIELSAMLDKALAHSQTAMASLKQDDLATVRAGTLFPDSEFQVTWSLMHALDHTALHLGHAQITRQLWDMQT